jgi:hypothetical protein
MGSYSGTVVIRYGYIVIVCDSFDISHGWFDVVGVSGPTCGYLDF